MAYDIGPRIGIEGEADFRKAINGINTNLRTLNTEMLSVTSEFDKNEQSIESVNAKNKVLNKQIDEQKNKLSELTKGLEASADKYGDNDKVTQGWRQSVNKANADLNNMERELKNNTNSLNNFSDEEDAATTKSGKFGKALGGLTTGLKTIGGNIGKAAITGIKTIGVAAIGAAAGMVALTESTREYRNDLAKLEQNAKTAGNRFDVIKNQLSGISALTGETDSAIEGLSNLMAIGFSDSQITEAVNALSGAVIKFPDTLKIESLADGLQETLATGAATGPFSELIGRMGGNLDDFNAGLENCTTQAEKQQYALDWLANSGLAQVNEQYKVANKDMLATAEAQFKLNDSMAGFAKVVEPAIASIKGGFADALSGLVGIVTGAAGSADKFKESVTSLTSNILDNIKNMIPTITTTMQAIIPALVYGIIDALPLLAEAAISILFALTTAIISSLPGLSSAGLEILTKIINTVIDTLPQIASVAMGILQTLASGITSALPKLIPIAISIITGLADMVINNIGTIVDMGINLILALVQGLVGSLPTLIQEVPRIINSFSNAIYAQIPKILRAGIDILLMLVKGIIDSVPTLIANIPQIIMAIVNMITLFNWWNLGSGIITKLGEGIKGMTSNIGATATNIANSVGNTFSNIFKGGLNWGKGLITNIANGFGSMTSFIGSSAKGIATSALNGITSIFSGGFNIGKNLIIGIWNGIKSVKQWILDQIGGFAGNIINGIKENFGINSPSKVMRDEVGMMLGLGMAEGITKSTRKVDAAMNGLNKKMIEDANVNVSAISSARSGSSSSIVNVNVPVVLDGKVISKSNGQIQYGKNRTRSRALGVTV